MYAKCINDKISEGVLQYVQGRLHWIIYMEKIYICMECERFLLDSKRKLLISLCISLVILS